MKPTKKVVVSENGPYLVSGSVSLEKEEIVRDKEGTSAEWKKGKSYPEKEQYALCRCGKSINKPYCDGTHFIVSFNGKETASKEPYLKKATKIVGPDLSLTDYEILCSGAGFCHKDKGTWDSTYDSTNKKSKKNAIDTACKCPSGRLVAWENDMPIELKLKQSISLIEDPTAELSGPIWVKGGIEIQSSDGTKYETRNRVTLCRCGESKNKPFCDGTHGDIKFRAEEPKAKEKK